MTGKELREYCKGKKVPIIFTELLEDLETRFDEGMKAYIVGVSEANRDNEITIKIEELDFAEYNKSIEKSTWLNRSTGEFSLKYHDLDESKHWDGKLEIYDNEDELCGNFELLNDTKIKLFNEYLDSKSDFTYIEWLEDKVLSK